jgi:hypothetical protein
VPRVAHIFSVIAALSTFAAAARAEPRPASRGPTVGKAKTTSAVVPAEAAEAAKPKAEAEAARSAGERAAPAPSPWSFDGSVGVPKLASDSFALSLDVTGGYTGEHLGSVVNFATSTVALQKDSALSSTSRTRFSIDAAYLTAPSRYRLEGRLSLGYASYSTTYIAIPTSAAGSSSFSAEGSGLARLSGLFGVRAAESETLSWTAAGGLGFQSESYTQTQSGGGASGGPSGNFSAESSVRLLGRGALRWRWMPDVVALRPELEASTFSLRRTSLVFGSQSATAAVSDLRAVEVSARVNVEVERLALWGFVPAVFGGLDFASVSGDAGSVTALVPLGGLALATTTP